MEQFHNVDAGKKMIMSWVKFCRIFALGGVNVLCDIIYSMESTTLFNNNNNKTCAVLHS